MLRTVGHQVELAPDGPAALAMLDASGFDMILSDINMPHMSGLKVRKNINQDKVLREKSIPFVFFSTAASPEQIKEAYHLTVQGFFLKEPTFAETEETFRLILQYWQKCKHPNAIR